VAEPDLGNDPPEEDTRTQWQDLAARIAQPDQIEDCSVCIPTYFDSPPEPWAKFLVRQIAKSVVDENRERELGPVPVRLRLQEVLSSRAIVELVAERVHEHTPADRVELRRVIQNRLASPRKFAFVLHGERSLDPQNHLGEEDVRKIAKKLSSSGAEQVVVAVASDIHQAKFWGENWK